MGGEAARGRSGQREEARMVTMGGDWELRGGGAHGVSMSLSMRGLILPPFFA